MEKKKGSNKNTVHLISLKNETKMEDMYSGFNENGPHSLIGYDTVGSVVLGKVCHRGQALRVQKLRVGPVSLTLFSNRGIEFSAMSAYMPPCFLLKQ